MSVKSILTPIALMIILGVGNSFANEIIIDKPNCMLYVITEYQDTIFAEKCALGRGYGDKKAEGDCRTPEGRFHIRDINYAWNWPYKGRISRSYGQWFIRLAEHPSIGIHGTPSPGSIGHRASHGCIRLTCANIKRLKDLVKAGDPVTILPDKIPTRKTDGKMQPKTDELIDEVETDTTTNALSPAPSKNENAASREHDNPEI